MTLEELYPKATPEQIDQVRETLDRYVDFVMDMVEKQEIRSGDVGDLGDQKRGPQETDPQVSQGKALEAILAAEGLKLVPEVPQVPGDEKE